MHFGYLGCVYDYNPRARGPRATRPRGGAVTKPPKIASKPDELPQSVAGEVTTAVEKSDGNCSVDKSGVSDADEGSEDSSAGGTTGGGPNEESKEGFHGHSRYACSAIESSSRS